MSLVNEALKYAKMGLAVFPVRTNKTPYTPHGCKDAKKDQRAIETWWKRWPDANIGIATGSISSGIIVIDIDIDEDKGIYGDDSLREWEREHGELPETWTAITGRGGYHYYFRTDQKIKNATGVLPGIDIRGEGGYVIAPPSTHSNGNQYQWEVYPEENDICFADDHVLSLVKANGDQDERREKFILPAKIESGKRNETLFKYGCSLQSIGVDDDEILTALEEANTRCDIPLESKEIKTIYESVLTKPKGIRRITDDGNLPNEEHPKLEENADGKILQTIDNAREAIQFDRDLYKKIRLNELAYAPYVFGELPWDRGNISIREWTNTDDANLKCYIEKKYGLKITDKIMDALTIVADINKYNPVQDLLKQRHNQWDGEPHIENLLPAYLGVEKCRYTTEVMKLFMLGAITRAFHPGCKFDYVPIIYGKQGCGKSTFCRALAMDDAWYNDNFNTIDGDKAAEKLRGLWMAELAELLATKKAKEVESIKSFITSRVDNYRPPYARRTDPRKRICVFIGTTNSDHFLTDRTGNRRFLPLIADASKAKYPINKPENYNRAIIDINNAWGEAMELYKQVEGKPMLMMPDDLESEILSMQRKFQEDDPIVGVIQEYLDQHRDNRICIMELWEKALNNPGKPQKYEVNQMHQIMQTDIDDWVRLPQRAKCGKYGLQTCYEYEEPLIPVSSDALPFK